jgi:hypothetical protein
MKSNRHRAAAFASAGVDPTLSSQEGIFIMDKSLTQKDLKELWYIVNSYGPKVWNADYVKELLVRVNNSRAVAEAK